MIQYPFCSDRAFTVSGATLYPGITCEVLKIGMVTKSKNSSKPTQIVTVTTQPHHPKESYTLQNGETSQKAQGWMLH